MTNLRRVLVAEVEMLISVVLQDMLEEFGYKVERASRVEDALKCATVSDYLAAILDCHLHGSIVDSGR